MKTRQDNKRKFLKGIRLFCNQCETAIINGFFCHETWCPNQDARYDKKLEQWIPQIKCQECDDWHDKEENRDHYWNRFIVVSDPPSPKGGQQ